MAQDPCVVDVVEVVEAAARVAEVGSVPEGLLGEDAELGFGAHGDVDEVFALGTGRGAVSFGEGEGRREWDIQFAIYGVAGWFVEDAGEVGGV